ncbi:DUF485 domain-containing protein [Streptomyces sp. NPDC056002]|uniref:DUF485 domain-containing protein n=1 Tax=Streptomyces sp. NPDC056002 TaxID=3345675 RepID=UPI0035E03721
MTSPHHPQSWPEEPGDAAPSFAAATLPSATIRLEAEAAAFITRYRRNRRRYAGGALVGYLAFTVVASTTPELMRSRVAGHLSAALLLMAMQIVTLLWAVAGQRLQAERLDRETAGVREQLAAHRHQRQA